ASASSMAASAARRSGSPAAAERPRAPAMLETAARPAITIATTTNALADLLMNRLPANGSNAACRGKVDARPGAGPDHEFRGVRRGPSQGRRVGCPIRSRGRGRSAAYLGSQRGSGAQARVEQVAQAVAEEVDAEHGQQKRRPGKDGHPGRDREEGLAVG